MNIKFSETEKGEITVAFTGAPTEVDAFVSAIEGLRDETLGKRDYACRRLNSDGSHQGECWDHASETWAADLNCARHAYRHGWAGANNVEGKCSDFS